MKRQSLIILFHFCTTSGLFAQMITHYNELFGGAYGIQEKEYIEGSRYLHEKFISGEVYYDDNSKVLQVPFRLNLHNDEFEYRT